MKMQTVALVAAILILLAIPVLIWRTRNNLKRRKPFEKEGMVGYSNGVSISENPYTNVDKTKELSWQAGWNSAKISRNEFLKLQDEKQEKFSEPGKTQGEKMDGSVKAIIWLVIFLVVSMLIYSYRGEDNKKVRVTYREWLISIPEQFGILKGAWKYCDTLDIYSGNIIIRKHGLLSDGTVAIPTKQIKKVTIGSYIGQAYIELKYEESIFGGSYRIYTAQALDAEHIKSFFDSNNTIIETN